MRAIKFQFLYKGLPFSSTDERFNWHKKVYGLGDICERGLSKISDVHGICELVAKRQFTGETDTNNKEIYEYDIVKLTLENAAWDEPTVYYKLVQFKDGCWMVGDNPLVRKDYAPHSTEVVGNLFETPELLSGR